MDRSCYRCGAQIEEHATFCPSCGAPQIKVTSPAGASSNQPSGPPLQPGTPDSFQPPALPAELSPGGRIQWGRFWRIALPLAAISGALIAFFGWPGVALFVVSLIIAINRYRREHTRPLTASQGALMGAVTGLVSYTVVLLLVVVQVLRNFGEFRQQWLQNVQQRMGGNPDPQMQQFVHWAATDQGLLVLSLISIVVVSVFIVVVSGILGAVTASLSRPRH